MAAPILKEVDLPNGQKQVRVTAATPEHLAWALAQVRSKYSKTQIDEETLLASANLTEGYINDPIVHKLELGGPQLFRGLLKACFNLLGAEHPEEALLSMIGKSQGKTEISLDSGSWILQARS